MPHQTYASFLMAACSQLPVRGRSILDRSCLNGWSSNGFGIHGRLRGRRPRSYGNAGGPLPGARLPSACASPCRIDERFYATDPPLLQTAACQAPNGTGGGSDAASQPTPKRSNHV